MPAAPWTSGSRITAAISSLVRAEDPRDVVGVARLGGVAGDEQRPEGRVEQVDAADPDRADRVAVIGLAEVDEGGAAACGPPRCC